MKDKKAKSFEDIFLDEIIWRVESIQKRDIKPAYDYGGLKTKAQDYKRVVDVICEIILEYIKQSQHLVRQKDNYEALLLDRMLADGVISAETYTKYNPIPIISVELLLTILSDNNHNDNYKTRP